MLVMILYYYSGLASSSRRQSHPPDNITTDSVPIMSRVSFTSFTCNLPVRYGDRRRACPCYFIPAWGLDRGAGAEDPEYFIESENQMMLFFPVHSRSKAARLPEGGWK